MNGAEHFREAERLLREAPEPHPILSEVGAITPEAAQRVKDEWKERDATELWIFSGQYHDQRRLDALIHATLAQTWAVAQAGGLMAGGRWDERSDDE